MARERQIKGCVLNLNAAHPDNTGTGAADKSDYRNGEATYEGGAGIVSGAFDFDGVDSWMDAGTSVPHSADKLSVFVWVKCGIAGGVDGLLTRYNTTLSQRSWGLLTSGDLGGTKLIVNVSSDGTYNASTAKSYTTSQGISTGSWVYVGFTFNAGVLKLYINGVDVTSTATKTQDPAITSLHDSTEPVALGCYNGSTDPSSYLYTGQLNAPQIFNRVLSDAEIANLATDQDFVPFGNYGKEVISLQADRYVTASGELLNQAADFGPEADVTFTLFNTTDTTIVGDEIRFTANVNSKIDSDHFVGGAAETTNSALSVSFWVYLEEDVLGTARQWMLGTDYGSLATDRAWAVRIFDNQLEWFSSPDGNTTSYTRYNCSDVFALNTWYHCVVVFDAGDVDFYVDGTLRSKVNTGVGVAPTVYYSPYETALHSPRITSVNYANRLKDVRISESVFSLQDVKYLYNNGTPAVETPNTFGAKLYLCPSFDDAGNDSLNVLDYSGNGATGACGGIASPSAAWQEDTTFEGIRKIAFDGNNDEVLSDLDISEFSAITIGGWAKPTGADQGRMFSVNYSGFDDIGLFYDDGDVNSQVRTDDGTPYAVIYSNPTADTWFHIMLTYDGTTLEGFLNGVSFGTIAATFDFSTALGGFSIGSHPNSDHIVMAVDDAIVFDRVITQDEIDLLANKRNAFVPSPVPESDGRRRQSAGIPGL